MMASTKITKFAHLQIPLEDVEKATNTFHDDNIIGRGGFGLVYKGRLRRSENFIKISAVRLDRKHREEDVEFWNEISVLSDLKHANIVSIVGFCDEKDEKIIITTYEAKGSLKEYINNPKLTWTQRLKISLGVARAMSYLRYDEGRGYGVIHLNINSSTILLDENWEAKLSGFKVSITQSSKRMGHVVLSELIGTYGYIDPAIEKTRGVTYKSDIYSFGVVLFEILCGREAYIKNDKNDVNRSLARLGKYHYEKETMQDIIRPDLWKQMAPHTLLIYSKVAYFCLNDERGHRPDTDNIIEQLEKALKLQLRSENLQNLGMNLENFRLDDIKLATHNFSDTYKFGNGEQGSAYDYSLYKAELDHFYKVKPSFAEGKSKCEPRKRHNTIVIKRFLPIDYEQEERFLDDLKKFTSVRHQNIVTLIGFCVEGSEMMLVIENVSNGLLYSYLASYTGMKTFTWEKRLQICIDIARALNYLHYEMEDGKMMLANNIDSRKIRFDDNWVAKIDKFDRALFLSPNEEYVVGFSIFAVSRRYVDVIKACNHERSSDVWCFGIVLLEILCGKLNNDRQLEKAAMARDRTLDDIVDPRIKEEINGNNFVQHIGPAQESLHTFIEIAHQCVAEYESQDGRPTMKVVLKELEKALMLFQASQEERVQQPIKDRVADEELQFKHEIPGVMIERSNTDQVADKLEKLLACGIQRNNLEHLMISLTDIQLATDNFSETWFAVHDGCDFYRAALNHFDPSFVQGKNKGEHPKRRGIVVIKRYPTRYDADQEERFLREIKALTNVKHHNIVTLVGLCVERSEMILVTKYVSNGYLGDYLGDGLFDKRRVLTWEKRLKICIDVAQALIYLHYEIDNEKMIINRDISSSCIALDENFGAKIVHFWLSAFLPQNQHNDGIHLEPEGRHCYIDPHYMSSKMLKRESDVYSFGVLLFEILCGKSANDFLYIYSHTNGLAPLVRKSFRAGTLEDKIDPVIKEETGGNILTTGPIKESLHTFIKIAYQCVAKSQDDRPTMKVVLGELENALMLFQEERVHQPNKDRVADEELQFTHEIPENNLEPLRFRLTDIQLATDNFSETYKFAVCDGCNLYRAALDHFDPSFVQGKNKGEHPKGHNTVVIKRYGDDQEEVFFTEIRFLKRVKHRNIVTLLGICVEGSEMILVIENVSNGYLNDYLGNIYFDKRHVLTWEKRLKICIDVAQALNYLHFEMEDQKVIINRDISSCGIVLDENFGAKIVHFWFSFFLPPKQSGDHYGDGIFIKPKGRSPYIDPHYDSHEWLQRESDVYSFGVVLFEILCGRTTYDPIYSCDLGSFVRKSFCAGTIEDMIDPIIKEESNGNMFVLHTGPTKESLNTFIKIAHQCLAKDQDERPTMKVVLKELEKALFLQKNKDHLRIPLEDIKVATQDFQNFIGGGGFGEVFQGNLRDGDGSKTIVAKRLDTKHGQGEKEFLTELRILLEYRHENVIGLVGYCDENDEKVIVYEYAPKGSLEKYLNDVTLTWVKRLNICIDVANALYFLHGGVGKQAKVIHRDIKTANILLNDDWKAKLGDFGLSFISPLIQETDHVIDQACGTLGYLDPLYIKYGFLTIESDIYSFGVVLFEILCGRSTYALRGAKGPYLQDFIKKNFEDGKHDELVFEQIREQIMPKSLTIFQEIAYQCLHPEREKRPATKEVLTQLKSSLAFQNMEPAITKLTHLKIPLEDIVKATDNFHHDNVIGHRHGGFVAAYKGRLMRCRRLMKIVARRFDCKNGEGYLKFWTEILMLSDLKHTNLVSVIGFCDEKDEKIIVHEANGSLREYLNNSNLTWTQRLRISVGVARALSYLHHDEGRGYAFIHRIINSDTILLDENSEAKLSSFEYSIKHFYEDEVHICEPIGVMGYMDPAIENTGGVTHQSDIYSFGVVLFEILSGFKAYDPNHLVGYEVEEYKFVRPSTSYDYESHKFLARLAKYHYEDGTLLRIVHPDIRNQELYPRSLVAYSKLAYSCLEERAYLDYIVDELQKTLESQLRFENIISSIEHLRIPLGDIKLATDDFSPVQKIRLRGCWTLYKECHEYKWETPSFLKGANEGEVRKVIIKRVRPEYVEKGPEYAKKGEEVFYKEIEMLTSVRHPNIVTLLGFCVEGPEMILVIEHPYNDYLDEYFGKGFHSPYELTWEKRVKVCIDIAHALNYLHYEIEDQKTIIGRNVKSYNIGLDEAHRAKISDFRYSIFLPPNQEDEALYDNDIVGNDYYIDPEYESTGKFKRESDVYSLGVVLFEILCGKLAYNRIYTEGSDKGLALVARRNFYAGTIEEMIDPIIKEETGENTSFLNRGANKDSLQTFIEIAIKCVRETQDQRPTMKVVVKELKKALFFQQNNKDNRRIPLADIKLATQNFHDDNCIAKGRFGRVFKGNLQDGDGFKTIVAKRLDKRLGKGEHQLFNELEVLWEYKHENIIGLVGYCNEEEETISVYEYASRRSLDRCLKDVSLTWMKRLNICIDVANVLDFIRGETGKRARMIHGDIKTAHILLNHDWKAKLAGFGLAVTNPYPDGFLALNAYSTIEYMDPRYKKLGYLTQESDIYSFGVVLFEILCGRSTYIIHKHEGHYLPDFIKIRFEEGKHDDVVFEQIREQIVPESLTTFQNIAFQCLHHDFAKRPTTKEVLTQLKKAMELQLVQCRSNNQIFREHVKFACREKSSREKKVEHDA